MPWCDGRCIKKVETMNGLTHQGSVVTFDPTLDRRAIVQSHAAGVGASPSDCRDRNAARAQGAPTQS